MESNLERKSSIDSSVHYALERIGIMNYVVVHVISVLTILLVMMITVGQ